MITDEMVKEAQERSWEQKEDPNELHFPDLTSKSIYEMEGPIKADEYLQAVHGFGLSTNEEFNQLN